MTASVLYSDPTSITSQLSGFCGKEKNGKQLIIKHHFCSSSKSYNDCDKLHKMGNNNF